MRERRKAQLCEIFQKLSAGKARKQPEPPRYMLEMRASLWMPLAKRMETGLFSGRAGEES
jgi:hypothetical protein